VRLVQLFDGRNATRRPETGQGLPPTRNASKAVRAASRVASYFVGGRDGQCAVWSIDDLRARLALSAALPVMCEWADNARSGCLLGYGPNRDELRRRIAHYVARIFRGSTPNASRCSSVPQKSCLKSLGVGSP
jgi:hypothetical protein